VIYVYTVAAPGHDLHDHTFDVQDVSRERADARAAACVAGMFSLSSRHDAKAVCVGEYTSKRAYERAMEAA